MFEDGILRYYDYPAIKNFSVRKGYISAIILHSTDSRVDKATLDWLSGREPASRVSAHWYITRRGKIFRIVDDEYAAWHAGKVVSKKYDNHHTIGIEMGHMDGREGWPFEQVYACAALCVIYRNKYGELPIIGHAFAASPPGRKVDPKDFPWEDFSNFYHELKSVVREMKPSDGDSNA